MPNGRGIAVKALRSLPKQKLVTVIMSNGASISMPMAVRKFMDKYRMTVDPTNHPLWSGKAVQVDNTGKVARFNRMFNKDLVEKQKAEKAAADAAFAKAEAAKYGDQE